jgi:hypothetical protein
MSLKDLVDHCPSGLDRVLAGEEGSVTGHGVAQESFIGCFLSRSFFGKVKLSLVADEFLPCALDARGDGDSRAWGESEAYIIAQGSRRC